MALSDLVFSASQPTVAFKRIETHPYECVRLMAYLVNPTSLERVVYDYVVALKDRFHERSLTIQEKPTLAGYNDFEKIALNAGIVKTLFQITKSGKMHMEGVFTSYFAAECLWNFVVLGKPEERRRVVKEFVDKHDVVGWCIKTASSAFFICHRTIAVMGLRILVTHCFLYEYLTIAETSELMKTLCGCILSGPKRWIDQMKDPATTWQSLYCFGTTGTPTSKARRYAPRYYALFQEHAAWTILNLVGRYPVPEQQFYNNLIKHDPELIDLLLQCAKVRREAWYPQLEVDARMVEAIALMLNIPAELVPGIKLEVDDLAVQEGLEKKLEALLEGVSLLMARPNWSQMISDSWKHIVEEKPTDIATMLVRAQDDYHAVEPYNPVDFYHTMMYRGTFRIIVLRLITTILLASETNPSAVSDADILNLLPISQAACQVLRTEAEIEKDLAFNEAADATARTTSAFHKPSDRVDPSLVNGTEDQLEQINDETITGPTCHIRLYIAMAKRGLFQKIQQWEAVPEGVVIAVGLKKQKELSAEPEVRRCVSLSVARVVERREMGNKTFREEKKLALARFEYWSAAQLAAALVEFDQVSNGIYSELIAGTKKELVMSLGNAAEMSLGQGFYDRALVFASAAVKAVEGCSGKDEIEQKVREKNERRVNRAKEGVRNGRKSA